MAGKDYDVAAAFQAIEYELINSFLRNMKKHKVDEVKEQKQWEMWQVKQLQELDLYKQRNAEKYGTKFTDINKTIAEMIRLSNEEGQMDQEAEILSAIEKGLRPQRAPEQMTAQFFRTNDRKLDTLINATVSDMERAEVAVLRKADDVYRKTIFDAMVYANTGAGTYEKAVDMATKDFMKAGLTCVEYKNGSKHTISDYADMAVRTANKRAYLQGEGAKRQEWGIHTVIVNKRLRACPHCMPFAGKVFIDDVWGGGTAADGDYPLLSEAVAAGLYHPRCKDSHTAYFPGITGKPKKYTKAEVKEAEKAEEQERKADYAERQAESYQRVADTRLDPENKRTEQGKADRWRENKKGFIRNTLRKIDEMRDSDPVSIFDIDTEEGSDLVAAINLSPEPIRDYLFENRDFITVINLKPLAGACCTKEGIRINLVDSMQDERGALSGAFHEIGHKVDRLMGNPSISAKYDFENCLRSDFKQLVENYRKIYNCSEEEAFKGISKRIRKPIFHSVSDLIGGITGKRCKGDYGHALSYWSRKNSIPKEAFAHFFEATSRNDIKKTDILRTTFPQSYKMFLKMLNDNI